MQTIGGDNMLFYPKWIIFQLHHGENKLYWYMYFNEMMMMSALHLVGFFFNQINSPRIDMTHHSNTLFWFRAHRSLPFRLNAASLAEKQQIPIL